MKVLAKNGCTYVEVPSSDWLFLNGSPLCVHLPHIQYFSGYSFRTLVARAGYSVVSTRKLFEGRDIGYVISRRSDRRYRASEQEFILPSIDFQALMNSVSIPKQNMSRLPSETAVYGANAGSQALLGWIPDGPWATVFDDTDSYWGNFAYSSGQTIPIIEPTWGNLRNYKQI